MRLISRLMLVLVALAIPATASSASEKLQTFGTGEATISESGTVTLSNAAGEYSGVYIQSWLREGGFKSLNDITHASFQVSGYVGAGSPRISLPLDIDGNGTTDAWAYLSALYCGVDGSTTHMADFTSNPATCTIYTSLDTVGYLGLEALQAKYPDARVARNNATFVILDETGTSTISQIQID